MISLIAAAIVAPTNVVLIYLDDAGYGDFGFNGNPLIRTPNLDAMAVAGASARQHYSVSPACSASRYALLTGRYPDRSGFGWVLNPDSPRYIHPRETTIAESLRESGYRTAIFGKWHLGNPNRNNQHTPDALPMAHGFDRFDGIPYSNDMLPPGNPDQPFYERNRIIRHNDSGVGSTTDFISRSLRYIDEGGKPFFVYLPLTMPHVPLTPGKEFAGKSLAGKYGDVIEEIDAGVGRLRSHLKGRGLARDTLLIFSSDNGPWILKKLDGGSSGPFRDGKGSTWEGGVRVPMLAVQPGKIASGTRIEFPTASIDIGQTIAKWTGAKPLPLADGFDLGPALRGRSMPRLEQRAIGLYGNSNTLFALRMGKYKWHRRTYSQVGADPFNDIPLPYAFDIARDPKENEPIKPDGPMRELRNAAEGIDIERKSFWNEAI